MRDALSAYGRAILDLWEEWFSLIGANLICFACFIPGLLVLFGLFGMVTQRPEAGQFWVLLFPLTLIAILAGGPAMAGVHRLTNPISHEKRIEFSYFWEGFKGYYLKSWKILGLWIVGIATMVVNIWFYRMWWQRGTQIALLPVVLFLWITVLWLGIQPYLFPLLLEQEDKRVLLIFKNAILLVLVNPGFTVLLMVLLGATLLLSLVFPPLLLLATISLVALVDNHALVRLLARLEEQRARYGLTEGKAESDGDEGGS
ncbi:MAG: hypothetical protein U9Q78_07090 [Chloroflexota bacterium]|nr:hypothetical protein [Chloroflexota bacterium]